METKQGRVWLITGSSSGLGRTLAERVLARGDRVVVAARRPADLDHLAAAYPDSARAIRLDVTRPGEAEAAVRAVLDAFGQIDVLANNAGYGLVGAVEETSDAEAHAVFETNFFGQFNTTRAVLPAMRARGSGHILTFSAVGGFRGVAGLGVYSAAKAAADVYSEALAQEVAPFGIRVTVIILGIFRTRFASTSLARTARQIDAYAAGPVGRFRNFIGQLDGKQPNDPERAAAAIMRVVEAEHPPLHLALGADALGGVRARLDMVRRDIDAWEDVAVSTGYPATERTSPEATPPAGSGQEQA